MVGHSHTLGLMVIRWTFIIGYMESHFGGRLLRFWDWSIGIWHYNAVSAISDESSNLWKAEYSALLQRSQQNSNSELVTLAYPDNIVLLELILSPGLSTQVPQLVWQVRSWLLTHLDNPFYSFVVNLADASYHAVARTSSVQPLPSLYSSIVDNVPNFSLNLTLS